MVVPVMAVLTKYEALVNRIQDASGGNPVTKKDIKLYLDKHVLGPIKNTAHPPAASVQAHFE